MAKEIKTLTPKTPKAWRTWLAKHYQSDETIWVVVSKKDAVKPTLSRSEAVEEALCYGWIDGTTRSLDDHYYLQSFCRRKPKSVWSRINKDKVAGLIRDGRMAPPGMESISAAKANGYWSILDEVEALIIPPDLEKELKKRSAANTYFTALSRSDKKRLLQWIVMAQRSDTRQKRIQEIVAAAAAGKKPLQFL
jgi:uncharacterized protein YdeI (YjbR/CyaY-like superfamily)